MQKILLCHLKSIFTTCYQFSSETWHKVFPKSCKRWGCSNIILESRYKLISFPVVTELSGNWSIHIGIRAGIELAIAHKSIYTFFVLIRHRFFFVYLMSSINEITNIDLQLLAERLGKSPSIHYCQTKREIHLI